MKRFAAFLLTLLLVFTLCSCGKKHIEEDPAVPGVEEHTDEEKQPKKPIPEVTKPEDTEEPVTDGETAPVPASKPTEKADDSSSGGGQSGGGYHGGGGHHRHHPTGGGGEDTPTVQDLTITEEKTVSGGTYKDVIIDAAVGNGTVTLDGVTIKGKLIVRGGGSNSIKVVGCDVSAVVLDKDTSGENAQAPRLELTGTEVQSVEVSQPAIIEATDAASAVQELSAKDNVTIKGEKTEIASVIVPADAENDVTLTVNDASVAKVEVNKPVTIETSAAAGKTPVQAVEAKANVTVSGAATNVGTVTVPADAGNDVKLTVEDAKVNSVSAEAPVTIEANEYAAKIDSVEAKADVTVAGENTKIDTITVPTGVTTAPEIKVTEGSVNTVDAKSEASVSGGENTIANVEAAAPVEVSSAAVAKVTVTVNVTVTVTGSSSVEVAVEVETSGSETVAIVADTNVAVNVSTTQEDAPTVKVNDEAVTHIHKWVESSRVNAGCKTAGSITYTCSEMGCTEITKVEIIPAKGHTEVVIPAVDPTCTAAGHTAGKKCAVCGETIVATRETPALGHDFTGSYVSDETAHWHVCSYCGQTDTKHTHTYSTTDCTVAARCSECGYQKAAGVHTWNAGTVQTAASCDTVGSMLYTCTSCAATKTETIPALGHTYGTPVFSWNGTNCTAARTCTREGCSHEDSAIAQISSYELKAPSCAETGVTVYTATVAFDGKSYSDTKNVTVETIEHTAVKQNGQAATCEENGWNDYYKCSKCQKLFSDENCTGAITDLTAWKNGDGKLGALGHDWAEAWNRDAAGHWHVCTRTGCTATSTKESHVPGAAATEDTAQTCTVCGYELAPATGHLCVNHLTEHPANAATCTAAGNSAYWSCTCGKFYSDANAKNVIAENSWVLSAIPHTYDQQVAEATYLKSAATCTAKAVYYKSCTCGAKGTETFEYGSALGHSFTNYVSDNNATCTADGTKTAKCDRCDATDTVADTDSKLGHSFTTKASAVKISDATCTAKAVYKVQCDRCDAVSDSVTVEVGEVNLDNHTGTLGEWQTDGSKHWKEYSCCGAKTDEAAHSGGTATCKNKAVCAVCNAEYGDLDQNNHSYGEASYEWNGDKCTATRVCANDNSHVETETADGVYTVVTEPTYTTAGSAVYVANFTNTAFTEQTSEAVTIPATPFKVGENTYATYEDALAAAKTAPKHIEDEYLGFAYDVYPTIELYGNCTVEGNLHLATATSITVKNGGSLTVGSLTLGESTMDGWWLDAGMLTLEQGSSFKLGDVQYTGTNGAFAMGNKDSHIELCGKAKDMEGNVKVAALYGNITLQGEFTVDSSYLFINDNGSVLTVTGALTNEAYLENRSEIRIVGGEVINKATIDNESGIAKAMGVTGQINILSEGSLTNNEGGNITGGNIDAYGSTVNNAGTIRVGDNCALVIENGSTLNNTGTLDGGQGSELDDGVYIYDDETVTNTLNGVGNVPVTTIAAVFDESKLQDALNMYDYVVPCGTSTTGTDTVTLDDLTVPAGKLLILKETVNDGTNQHHNKFVLGDIEIQRDLNEEDPHNGNLVTVGNPDVTVNGRIDARGFIAFDTLTIANGGYVYVENEMMIVSTALTVAQGGTLEIGSGSQMYYQGKTDAVINGTLIETVRNMNGFVNQVRSDIQGLGMTPNKALTTLVITEDTILHGNYTVDTVIPVKIEFVNKEGENVTLTPTLRVGANSSLEFKELYTGEGGTADQIIGLTGEDGNYTVLPTESSAVIATNTDAFFATLDDPTVTDITITEDITLTYADALWNHPVTKAVMVAKGVTLEVKPYTPGEDGPAEPGMKFNGLVIAANGSLTLEDGTLGFNKAVLKTDTITSGENDEMWFEYRSQVNVSGGVLDASQGKLETDSTGNIDFEAGNGQLLLPGTVSDYLITYTVDSKEELLSANSANDPCNNILLVSDVVLTEDYTVNKALTVMNDEQQMYRLTVVPETTLTVPENKTLYVNGELRVEGELVNNGTITGEGFIDVMGGTLNNSGAIDLAGDIGVEKGGTVQNSGSVSENTSFTLADYWYSDGKKETYVLAEGTTLETLGDKVTIMAVAFSPKQVRSALGEEKYGMVMACGENDESTVELNDITVLTGKILMLKDFVDVGERTIHNTYDLTNITFKEDAYLLIMGDPAIHINGELDYGHVIWKGNPDIYALGFVHNEEGLEAALQNGGDIYLYPFAMEDRHKEEFTFEDGHTEEVYETQYWIDTTTIATDTNLIKMGGEDPMAVFFKNGFTVTSDTTLRFDGLNVVAAADSTVNGRVEACNGALVVQGENGATLTNNGTIQIGSEEVWGQFAIFDENAGNKIVNNGRIESYGELRFDRDPNRNPLQFTGNDPIEYATFRDLVCDLQRDFGNLPNLKQINFEEKNESGPVDLHWLYEKYPEDGQELERNEDYDAIGAFAWLIKNDVISNTPTPGTKLNPWHYMTCDEVGELFNKFASTVRGTATDLDITGNGLADKNFCFGKLYDALGGLSRAEVTTEQQLREALNAPYVTEIHITGNIVLSSNIDLQPAGEHHDQHREIFIDPNFTLTVPQGIQMDIKQNVKLRIADGGQLIVNGNVNVFGELEPDENDRSRITVDREHGGNISYFGNAYFFGERLLEVAGEYMSQKDVIPEGYDRIDGWDDNEKVTCLVAYGLEPESDENGSWWNFGRPLNYGEMKTVLTKVYQEALATSSDLPGTVKAGDENWTPDDSDCLDNRSVEELLSRFALVLPKRDDATTSSFVIQRTNDENHTDGKTIIGKTFNNAITVTAVKTNDNFAGELNFVNCTFNGGITLIYNPDCDYRVNFSDSCTGTVSTDYPEGITGGNRRIRIAHPNGMTITANALTAFEMNDGCLCSTDSFTVNGLTINGNGCENLEVDVRKDDTTPTIEVTGSENGSAIELSGSYTGKLRVSGCIDVSRVALGTDSWIELANWYDEENHCGAPDSTINLGTNDISINDDNGSHRFIGTGTIHVNGGSKENLQLIVNNRNLATPHVFGGEGNYGIFLGLADVNGVTFVVKQGNSELNCVSILYGEDGPADEDNPAVKTHLEKDGENLWITDPGNISLTVKVTDGCTIVYENLRYNGQ